MNNMTPDIIFQNSHFLIIDKPAEVLSVPSRTGEKDPRPVAGIMMQELLGKKIYPVHRIDEDVSGLLMFALTADAHRTANQWFEKHEVVKTYEALSLPIESDREKWTALQLWTCKLMRGKKRAYEAEFGKDSSTRAQCVGENREGRSVWHLQPLTGRSHQLRYEMTRHGFPIDGDSLYASQMPVRLGAGISLRAFRLDFSSCQKRDRFEFPAEIQLPSSIEIKKI